MVPPPGMGAGGMLDWFAALLSGCFHDRVAVRSVGLSRRHGPIDDPGDGPGEAEHLAGDGHRHHRDRLAGGDQSAIAGAESALPLPGDVTNLLGKPFQAIEVGAGDPGRQAVGPGGLDQDAARRALMSDYKVSDKISQGYRMNSWPVFATCINV